MARRGNQHNSIHVLDFGPSSLDNDMVAHARGIVSSDTILHAGTSYLNPLGPRKIVIFLPFLMAGMVLPFS